VEPAELARAELAEETGLRAGSLELLGHLHCAYGMSSQGFDVFLATELTPGPPAREESEQDMRQRRVSRAEFEQLIRSGRVTDDSTLAAYALLLMREAGRL
jgi:8-oxo-dGDP phosphatase